MTWVVVSSVAMVWIVAWAAASVATVMVVGRQSAESLRVR